MNQPIIPKHARLGVCALCNYTDWVVPEYTHETFASERNICRDTVTCAQRQVWNREVEMRADFITGVKTMCDEHLLSCWGFTRAEGTQKWAGECAWCAEEMAEEMLWERSGFTRDDLSIGECGVIRAEDIQRQEDDEMMLLELILRERVPSPPIDPRDFPICDNTLYLTEPAKKRPAKKRKKRRR